MNFRVIENPDPGYNIEDVKKDYQNTDISVQEIKEKYGISNGTWLTILKHWKDDGIPLRNNRNKNKPLKYYVHDKRNDVWYVYRTIHSRRYYFGTYHTEEEAQRRVAELHRNRWNGLLRKGEE